jgi:hypothetical protein
LLTFPGNLAQLRGANEEGWVERRDRHVFVPYNEFSVVATVNRMSILLTCEEEFDTWLGGSVDEAFALAPKYPAQEIRIVQRGLKVGESPQSSLRTDCSRSLQDAVKDAPHLQGLSSIEMPVE